jgi:adenosylhomocysteine nucleosidase
MIGIIGAMPEELSHILGLIINQKKTVIHRKTFYEGQIHDQDVVVVLAGIGKVNAALTTTLLLSNFACDEVINIGVAGGQNGVKQEDIVIGEKIVHHDVDVTAFGNYIHGQVPNDEPFYQSDMEMLKRAKKAINDLRYPYQVGMIASGDQFVYQSDKLQMINQTYDDIYAVEMEAAAIAQVCSYFDTPFVVFRSISDVIGEKDQHLSFDEFLDKAALKTSLFLERYLEYTSKV